MKKMLLVVALLLLAVLPVSVPAATMAAIIQLDGTETTGPNALLNVHFYIIDSTAQVSKKCVATDLSLPIDDPGTWKTSITSAVVTEAANTATCGNFTVTQSNVRYLSYEPGDYNYVNTKTTWTKDITKTNVPATYTNAYIGNSGEGQLVNFSSMSQYRFVYHVNKIGTGTQTAALVDVTNAANLVEVADSGAAGEHTIDSGWTSLPAWAAGEKIVKPMVKSSVTTDDPIYRGFMLYVR